MVFKIINRIINLNFKLNFKGDSPTKKIMKGKKYTIFIT
jgi:hypothetical protein